MHLRHSRRHPSMWLMKGPKPKDQQTLAYPIPSGKFAETHTWVGHQASNMDFPKALEEHWKMSTPEHLGRQHPNEKMKFIGVMITRAKAKDSEYPEGSYYVGQGAYALEVLDIFSSSMNYKGRTTPGEPESFSKGKKVLPEVEPCEAQGQHGTFSTLDTGSLDVDCMPHQSRHVLGCDQSFSCCVSK
eukprot:9794623-Prorocentrum_lima.AAC.1